VPANNTHHPDVRPVRSQFGLSEGGRHAFARLRESNALPSLRVLSASQFAAVELLADTIHPADGDSPGAIDWRVADYVDLLLSESDDVTKLQWLSGLAELDQEATAGLGLPFLRLSEAQRQALVAELHRGGRSRESALEAFVELVELASVCACFASEASGGH
jgi:hypothetical protein